MAGMGLTHLEIANLIDISDETLRKYYRRELTKGVPEANLRVAKSLFRMATEDKVPAAAIWWTKARMGWKEATDVNVGGQDNKPLVVDVNWAPAILPIEPVKRNGHAEPETNIRTIEHDATEAEVVWKNDTD